MISSIVLALYLMGIVGAEKAAAFLVVIGVFLIVSEFLFPSGLIAFGGVTALYVAYSLKYGQSQIFGHPVGWEIVFGTALLEALIVAALIFLILRHRRQKTTTGAESMIGSRAEVTEWSGRVGRVRIQGETWKAVSIRNLDLAPGEKVTVEAIENLTLVITP